MSHDDSDLIGTTSTATTMTSSQFSFSVEWLARQKAADEYEESAMQGDAKGNRWYER